MNEIQIIEFLNEIVHRADVLLMDAKSFDLFTDLKLVQFPRATLCKYRFSIEDEGRDYEDWSVYFTSVNVSDRHVFLHTPVSGMTDVAVELMISHFVLPRKGGLNNGFTNYYDLGPEQAKEIYKLIARLSHGC